MFDDIGGKIKTLAKINLWAGYAASIIGAIAALDAEQQLQPDDNYRHAGAGVGFAGFMDRFIFHLWIWSVD